MTHRQKQLFSANWVQIQVASKYLDRLAHAAPFCLLFSNLGTIFAQIFLIPRFSKLILYTLSLFMPSSYAIILTVRRQSLRTFSLTRPTYSSFLLVDGLPLLGSSSKTALSSLNFLSHPKSRVLDIMLSTSTS